MWHNETINVWSHLIGVILFFIFGLAVFFALPDMSLEGVLMEKEFSLGT